MKIFCNDCDYTVKGKVIQATFDKFIEHCIEKHNMPKKTADFVIKDGAIFPRAEAN